MNKKKAIFMITAMLLPILLWALFWGGLIYIGLHFVLKWW